MKKVFIITISFIFLVLVSALTVMADEETCGISVFCEYEKMPLEGANVRLYRVAEQKDDTIQLLDDFDDYQLSFSMDTAEESSVSAWTLLSYANAHQIKETATCLSLFDGRAYFNHLSNGIYLVAVDRFDNGDNTAYEFTPFLVTLPYSDSTKQEIQNELIAYPKAVLKSNNPSSLIDITVVKIWHDEGFEDIRPDYVDVSLYKGDELVSTIRVTKEMNWTYEWKDMPENADYYVVEHDTGIKYLVDVTKENDYKFVIVAEITEKKELPRTGLLWIPIPILFILGVVLMGIGMVLRKKNEKE